MTEKELFEIAKTYGYGKNLDKEDIPEFSDTGKIFPGSSFSMYYHLTENDEESFYNFYDFNLPYIEFSKRRTSECLVSVTMLILDEHFITEEPDDDPSNMLFTKNFNNIPISKISKEKILSVFEQNKKIIKNMKNEIKKYKIKEGF